MQGQGWENKKNPVLGGVSGEILTCEKLSVDIVLHFSIT